MGEVKTYKDAAGVKGIIIGEYFRVYSDDKSTFTDYKIKADDISVTIAPDEMLELVEDGEKSYLDYSRKVLGTK